MSVNGVLEGYLTVYGWDVYAAIFLLLVAVGLVLYPVARVLFDLAITYAEGGSTPEAGARTLIVRLCIYLLVLVLGLIPLAPKRAPIQLPEHDDTPHCACQCPPRAARGRDPGRAQP